jgi:putative DNA methylase
MRPAADQPLLSRLDWARIDKDVQAHQRNREKYTPPISLFRWWARRSHVLIGAILDAAVAESDVPPRLADPFSGGATVALEGARRGLPTYAQDLHPWTIAGLHTALDGVTGESIDAASETVLSGLTPLRRKLYRSPCAQHGDDSEVLTSFWVGRVGCPECASPTYLYPYSLVTVGSRRKDEEWGYYGCTTCGVVSKSSLELDHRRCLQCLRRLPNANANLLLNRLATCPNCARTFPAFDINHPPSWRMVLIQRSCRSDERLALHFDEPSSDDIRQAYLGPSDVPRALLEGIPVGLETEILRRAGFDSWASLYPPRQLSVMLEATKAINGLDASSAVITRLQLALCGASEMAGRLSRWDRYYPKAFEAIANHRFSATGLSAEVNILAERGRGTLPRRFAASAKAARWAEQHLPATARARKRDLGSRRSHWSEGVLVAQGSSERQLASNQSIDLVLTDPPYFDDVQYGELAGVFLVWARAIGLLPDSIELDLQAEAVANAKRGTDVARYRELLCTILQETKRTLKANGRVVLTFHNTDLRAWWALGRALSEGDLQITALAVVHSENERDHPKRGKAGFTKDLVIECRSRINHTGPLPTDPIIASLGTDPEALELLAVGRALAQAGRCSFSDFRQRFVELRGDLDPQRIDLAVGFERRRTDA